MRHIKKETYEKALKTINAYVKQEQSKNYQNYVTDKMYNDVLNLVKQGYSIAKANKELGNDNTLFHKQINHKQKQELKQNNQLFKNRKGYITQIGFENVFNLVLNGETVKNACEKHGIGIASYYNHLNAEQKRKLKIKEIENAI